MTIAIICPVKTQYWYEPARAASEAIAALTGAVYNMDDEVAGDNDYAERLTAIACQMAENNLFSEKTLEGDMAYNSVANVAFDLHALIDAALNYPGEVLEIKRRTLLVQALRITDALTNMLCSGGKEGLVLVPALLDLINVPSTPASTAINGAAA